MHITQVLYRQVKKYYQCVNMFQHASLDLVSVRDGRLSHMCDKLEVCNLPGNIFY